MNRASRSCVWETRVLWLCSVLAVTNAARVFALARSIETFDGRLSLQQADDAFLWSALREVRLLSRAINAAWSFSVAMIILFTSRSLHHYLFRYYEDYRCLGFRCRSRWSH